MNASTQLDGEKIAKAVAARSQALDTLLNEKRAAFSWQYLGLALLGAVWGWAVSQAGADGHVLVAGAAGAGFFIAAAALRECIKLRRRLDAMLVILKGQEVL